MWPSKYAYSNFFDIFGYLPNRKIEKKKMENNREKAALSNVIRLLITERKQPVVSEGSVITS